MERSEPGDPGQAGTYDPKTGGKFEPTTTASPTPESTHSKPGKGKKKAKQQKK